MTEPITDPLKALAAGARAFAQAIDPQSTPEAPPGPAPDPIDPANPPGPTDPPPAEPEPYEPEIPETPPTPPASSGEFYVDGGTQELEAQRLEAEGMKAEAGYVRQAVSGKAQAIWYNGGDTAYLGQCADEAKALGQDIISVLYNVPDRDAGNFSKGGAENLANYKASVDAYVEALGDTPAWVIVEPDATNLPDQMSQLRIDCLNYALERLSKVPTIHAYVDAGHSNWRSVEDMAQRLNSLRLPANVGLSLNVSSWQSTQSNVDYFRRLKPLLKGSSKRLVVDTSRNGTNTWPVYEWCNVWHQKAGTVSTTETGMDDVDAFLWVKRPGESDGQDVPAGHIHRWWLVDFAKHTLGVPTE